LLVYAPIVALAPVGWVALFHRKQFDLLLVSLIACVAVFLVNLSYPEWTGGWCTGPRLLLPLLPFAMLAVAAALAIPDRQIRRAVLGAAVILTLAGAVIMTICLGVGGRIPSAVNDVPLTHPLSDGVLRLWIGQMSPDWWIGGRFVRNLVSIAWPAFNDPTVVPPQRQWLQFLPLWIGQIAAITWLLWRFRPVTPPSV
jgi:hypothetical protein